MIEQAADNRQRSVGNRCLFTKKSEIVGNTFGADFRHAQMNVNDFFESNGIAIVALGLNPGPANILSVDFTDDTKIQAAEKFMFRLLHVGKEIGEMNNARSICIPEFNSALSFEHF